jgi:hypothetical protein
MKLRGIRPLLAILSLCIGVSCTAGDLSTEPELGPKISGVEIPTVTKAPLALLQCDPQRYASATRVIGPKGGRIKFGTHSLNIPAGALSQDVTILAEQVTGLTNSVRFSPEGLTFAQPAELTMSYDNCASVAAPKSIVYTTEQLQILEQLKSSDKAQSKSVVSPVDHFSRYAVAY